jgi:hypothetical protein
MGLAPDLNVVGISKLDFFFKKSQNLTIKSNEKYCQSCKKVANFLN